MFQTTQIKLLGGVRIQLRWCAAAAEIVSSSGELLATISSENTMRIELKAREDVERGEVCKKVCVEVSSSGANLLAFFGVSLARVT